ncbi:MAG TPA: hypothetical protein PKX16_08560 [Kiritimatiellia bacterium]|nr:hypothetical protein [Kiritimatiellia bacterium]
MAERAQFLDDFAGIGRVAVELAAEALAVLLAVEIDLSLLEEIIEFVEGDAVGKGLGKEVVFVHFLEEFDARAVGNFVGAGIFESVGAFGGNPAALAEAGVLDLEAFLARGALAQEIEQDFAGDIRAQEGAEFVTETRIRGGVDAGFGIHDMDPAGTVGDNGDLLVFEGAAGLGAEFGAVEPHGLGDQPPVVGEDAVVNVDKVLGVQRSGDKEDVFEGDAAEDVECGGIERGQRYAFAGAPVVAGHVAEGVHRLDRFGFPVRDDIGGILVQAEVAADIEIEVELIAFVAEQSVAPGDGFGRDVRGETGEFAILGREAPRLEIEVERVVVHDELLEAQNAAIGRELGEIGKPGVRAPGPDARRHEVGEHERIKQARKYEDFHVGKCAGRGIFLEARGGHGGKRLRIHCPQDSAEPARRQPFWDCGGCAVRGESVGIWKRPSM